MVENLLTNLDHGLHMAGWIFLMYMGWFVMYNSCHVSSAKICHFQRNMLYINGFLVGTLTPLLYVAGIFNLRARGNHSVLSFTGNDMPLVRYVLGAAALQLFAIHQMINVTRILYELYGVDLARSWFAHIGIAKMIFYFVLGHLFTRIAFNILILIVIDYVEHITAAVIYGRMICASDDWDVEQTSADNVTLDVDKKTTDENVGVDYVTRRAKWGLFAVMAHMVSIVPYLAIVLSQTRISRFGYNVVFIQVYLTIGLSIYAYNYLILATPAKSPK